MADSGIDALKRAKDILGSESALADAVGVKQPSVNYMLNSGKRVPAEWCIPVEHAVAEKLAVDGQGEPVTRHQLREDLYPLETDPQEAAA